jgi:hypothetical protein
MAFQLTAEDRISFFKRLGLDTFRRNLFIFFSNTYFPIDYSHASGEDKKNLSKENILDVKKRTFGDICDQLEERINDSSVYDIFRRRVHSIEKMEENPFRLMGIPRRKFGSLPLFLELNFFDKRITSNRPLPFSMSLYYGASSVEETVEAIRNFRGYSAPNQPKPKIGGRVIGFTDERDVSFNLTYTLRESKPSYRNPFSPQEYADYRKEVAKRERVTANRTQEVLDFMTEIHEASQGGSN